MDTVDGLHDANLVAYYDFEGETPYADKAPNGDVADNMKAVNVIAANGVAKVPADAGAYLSIAKGSADVADLNGKTIYIKYNTTGAIGGENNPKNYGTDMFNANDTFRYWLAYPSTATYYAFAARTIVNGTNVKYNNVVAPTTLAGDWYYTAFTFDLQADQLVIKIYNSANGSSYSVSDFVSSGEQLPVDLVCELDILFGKHTTGTAATNNRGIGFNFDEIRIYDTVLSADDIAGLSTETPRESCINLLGWQDKDNGNGTQDVRFLAHLNVFEEDLAKFSSVGFKITATYKGETKAAKEITADTVYTSVVAGNETVTLADYDQINGYIIALPVWNVPTDSEVVFTVQTFYQLIGSDAPVYGEAVNVVYNAA